MSLNNPTSSFLSENFTKVQLQKHCQELGLTGLWVKKDKLIEKILEHHRASSEDVGEGNHLPIADRMMESDLPMEGILADIRSIKEKLAVKDVEIDDLYEKLRKADLTIVHLQERIKMLEEREECSGGTKMDHSVPVISTLLLGDAALSQVNRTDLDKSSFVRTIRGANVDLLGSWVREQLEWTPTRCIFYGGMEDLEEDSTPGKILDSLGTLVSELKIKNPEMEISVCQLVPTLGPDDLQAKINEFNLELKKWGLANEVNVIDTNTPFRIATGEIDENCYNMEGEKNEFSLNRIGAIRLLSHIARAVVNFKLCENWQEVKRNVTLVSKSPSQEVKPNHFIPKAKRSNFTDTRNNVTYPRNDYPRDYYRLDDGDNNMQHPRNFADHGHLYSRHHYISHKHNEDVDKRRGCRPAAQDLLVKRSRYQYLRR